MGWDGMVRCEEGVSDLSRLMVVRVSTEQMTETFCA